MTGLDYKALRRKAQTNLQRQKILTRWVLFVVNLMLYLLFVVLSWGMFLSTGAAKFTPNIPGVSQQDPITGAMIMLTVMGGLGVMFQFISAFLDTRLGEAKMRDQIMGRLVSEEILRLGGEDDEQEKAKRVMRLTDEGELEEEVMSEEEIMAFEEQQRASRK
jgi:hypothetical protein